MEYVHHVNTKGKRCMSPLVSRSEALTQKQERWLLGAEGRRVESVQWLIQCSISKLFCRKMQIHLIQLNCTFKNRAGRGRLYAYNSRIWGRRISRLKKLGLHMMRVCIRKTKINKCKSRIRFYVTRCHNSKSNRWWWQFLFGVFFGDSGDWCDRIETDTHYEAQACLTVSCISLLSGRITLEFDK